MRALPVLLAAACAAPQLAPPPAGPPPCDSLPFLGAAEPKALASDAQGGLAVAGDFRGPLRVGSFAVEGAGSTDVFVARTAPDGSLVWLRRFGGAGPETAGAVALAANGDAVAAGEASGKCFALRLAAADGHEIWRAALDTKSSCTALAPDKSGDFWMVGAYEGKLGSAYSNGLSDAFAVRVSGASGEMRLLKAFGGKGRDVAHAVAVTPSGDVLVAGQFGGEVDRAASDVDFGKGAVRSAGDFDGFLVDLAPNGATRWAATFGENGEDDLTAIAVSAAGVVYAAGQRQPAGDFEGRAPADVGSATGIALRWSKAGIGEWVRLFEGQRSSIAGIAFDDAGRLWTAGSFLGELRAGQVSLTSAGRWDIFAVALAPANGEPLGSRSFGSNENDLARAVARIPGGIALAGSTRGELRLCGKPLGTTGEQTGFVVWLRDLAK